MSDQNKSDSSNGAAKPVDAPVKATPTPDPTTKKPDPIRTGSETV